MTNPRILHILTRLISGGADENTLLSIRGLQDSEYDIELLVGGESDEHFVRGQTDIRIIVLDELRRNILPLKDLIAFYKIYTYIKKNQFHIVHTHTAKAGFLGRLAARCAGTPIIIHTIHGITFHDFLNPLVRWIYIVLEKVAGKFTNKLIMVGEDVKQKYVARNIAKPDSYVTIRSGFHLREFIQSGSLSTSELLDIRKELDLKYTDLVIGTVSRLEPRKGHIYLFEAAIELIRAFPQIQILIAGEGSHREFLESEARRLHLAENIRFLGYRNDIAELMALFDIFVLTSLWEGLPRVLVQAAALGKPIVTFDVEGANEIVVQGVNGFVVPPKNVALLKERIAWFIQHQDQARQMGLAGKALVTDAWEAETMVRQIKELYDEMITISTSQFRGKN
ncbi:glycosyltransferase family 4 protein [candidate division KSB1 bacterium]|nr:glycosyltransferase family 4 protein [candidate division KSB1 bacterium]